MALRKKICCGFPYLVVLEGSAEGRSVRSWKEVTMKRREDDLMFTELFTVLCNIFFGGFSLSIFVYFTVISKICHNFTI